MTEQKTPRFSLLMPAYNAADVIARAIESVLAQTYEDWELIVTNDGSRDETASVVERYIADPRSRGRIILVTQENRGCGAARDTSAKNARGTYFVRFDADDELMPHYLERMDAAIKRYPGHDIYCCNGVNRLPDGTTAPARKGARYDHPQQFTMEDMFEFVHIFTIALFSSEIYHKVGRINPYVYCEDVRFWFDAFLEGATCQYIPEALAYYTVSDTQMTSDFERVANSCIGIYESLIESARLTPAQTELARGAIERTRNDLVIYEKRTKLVRAAERVVGKRGARVVSALIHGAGKLVRPLYARLLSARRPQPRRVALTFDVEPPGQAQATQTQLWSGERILNELAKRSIKATFFVQGAWADAYPDLAKRIVDEGHTLGNHTYHHIRLDETERDEIIADIALSEETLKRVTGVSPRPYFRCPQNAGGWDTETLELLKSQGYRHIHWNVDTYDWEEGANIARARELTRAGLASYEPTVVLLHSWTDVANEHLGELIDEVASTGASFVTVSELDESRATIKPMTYETSESPRAARSLGRSIAWGAIARVASVITNVLFSIILARALGPAGKGQYAVIQQFVSVLVVVLNFGLPTSNVYFVASEKISARTAFSNSVGLLLPTTLISAVATLLFLVSPFRGSLAFSWGLFAISCALFATTALYGWLNAVLQGKHGLKAEGVSSLAQAGALLLGSVGLVAVGRVTIVAMLGVALFSQLVAVCVLLVFDRQITRLGAVDWAALRSMVRYSLQAYFIDLTNFLHFRQDILILGWLSTAAEVGQYSVAVSFAELVRYLPIIISAAFFAEVATYSKSDQEARTALLSRLNVGLNLVLGVGFVALVPIVLPLMFGAAFKPAVLLAFALLPGTLLASIAEIPSALLFTREEMYWKFSGVLVVVNIVLNVLAMPRYGAFGAAIISSTTYALFTLGILVKANRRTGLTYRSMLLPTREDARIVARALKS